MTWRDRSAKYGGLLVALVFIAFLVGDCVGLGQQPGPPPREVFTGYAAALETADGGYLIEFHADDLPDLQYRLREAMLTHCRDDRRKYRVRIWDRAKLEWVRMDGTTLNQPGTPLGEQRDWLPCEVSCHVGNARF